MSKETSFWLSGTTPTFRYWTFYNETSCW